MPLRARHRYAARHELLELQAGQQRDPAPVTLHPDVHAQWIRLFARLCGSPQAAERALRPLIIRAAGWRSIDRWHESPDTMLCRAWLERPNLVALGDLTLDHDATPLARVLAHEPCERWVVWALVTLGGWRFATLSRLSTLPVIELRRQVQSMRELLRERSRADVLLIGPDPVQLADLERVLREAGHVIADRVVTRESLAGFDAHGDIDLVLIDLDVPGRGLDAAVVAELARRSSAAQLLLVTELSLPAVASLPERCVCVHKPVDPGTLLDCCAEAILDVFPDGASRTRSGMQAYS